MLSAEEVVVFMAVDWTFETTAADVEVVLVSEDTVLDPVVVAELAALVSVLVAEVAEESVLVAAVELVVLSVVAEESVLVAVLEPVVLAVVAVLSVLVPEVVAVVSPLVEEEATGEASVLVDEVRLTVVPVDRGIEVAILEPALDTADDTPEDVVAVDSVPEDVIAEVYDVSED